jgi:hypothetical protein
MILATHWNEHAVGVNLANFASMVLKTGNDCFFAF